MLLPLPLQNNIAGTGMARQLRKKSGAGIRQLSRLTGVSFGVIQKLKNDQ